MRTCSLPFSLSPSSYFKINGHFRKGNLTRIERTLQFFSREKITTFLAKSRRGPGTAEARTILDSPFTR